jgi:DNA mismatch endonuclease (patch repair protein)
MRALRFRVDFPVLPRRRADIAFPKRRIAVFIDGCFWHDCPDHGTVSKANAEFWAAKLMTNKERDRDTDDRLAEGGWTVLRFWEHERAEDIAVAIEAVVRRSEP